MGQKLGTTGAGGLVAVERLKMRQTSCRAALTKQTTLPSFDIEIVAYVLNHRRGGGPPAAHIIEPDVTIAVHDNVTMMYRILVQCRRYEHYGRTVTSTQSQVLQFDHRLCSLKF